jgi:hypothetical protein
MITATGYLATRRLDAAREALRGLQQPEGYDEPEILAFITEWMDPWNGSVDEDDIWDWENNSAIDHLNEQMRMLRYWTPKHSDDSVEHSDRLSMIAKLSSVASLRMQRRHEEALQLALETVKFDPLGVRPRIAVALCLIDKGNWHQAMSVYQELKESDVNDPRVIALSVLLGNSADVEHIEVSLAVEKGKNVRKWLDEAPVNAVAGLGIKGGIDEAINANIMICAHESVRRGMTPRYSPSIFHYIIQFVLLPPIFIVAAIAMSGYSGQVQGIVAGGVLFMLQFAFARFRRQQGRQIKHRDQRSLVDYARMMKRFKVNPNSGNIPIGTHLLLSGILVTVNGVVLDVGMPGWLTHRLPKDADKTIRARLKRNALTIGKNKPAKLKPLTSGWWLKRPKEEASDFPILEQLIGPVAYRGRQTMLIKKTTGFRQGTSSKPSFNPVDSHDFKGRDVPRNTRTSERSARVGPSRPSRRR